MQFFGMSHCG